MTGNNIIYGLVDPNTGHLRYVGKSSSGMRRPKVHFTPSSILKNKSYKNSWLRSLGEKRPNIVVLQEVDPEVLDQAERFWIVYFRSLGCPLTNLSDGGEGQLGMRHTQEARAKISAASKGRVKSPAERARLSLAHKGKRHSAETKAKVAAARNSPTYTGGRQKIPIIDQHGTIYASQTDASVSLGINKSDINLVLKGHRSQAKGYVFKYLEGSR